MKDVSKDLLNTQEKKKTKTYSFLSKIFKKKRHEQIFNGVCLEFMIFFN